MAKQPYKKIDYNSPEGQAYMQKYNAVGDNWPKLYAEFSAKYPDLKYSPEQFKALALDKKYGPVHEFVKGYNSTTPFTPVAIDPSKRKQGIVSEGPVDPGIELQTNTPYKDIISNVDPNGNSIVNQSTTPVPKNQSWKDDLMYFNPMRMAPIFEALGNVLNQEPPDNTLASELRNSYNPVNYEPFGQQAAYTPFDWRALNITQRAKDRANQQAIVNTAGGNSAVARAALSTNNLSRLGDIAANYTQGLEADSRNRLGILGFNNQLEQANKTAQMQIDQYNNANQMKSLMASAQVWDAEKKLVEQVTSQNKSALSSNLGALGSDYINYSLIKNNPAFLYTPLTQNLKK